MGFGCRDAETVQLIYRKTIFRAALGWCGPFSCLGRNGSGTVWYNKLHKAFILTVTYMNYDVITIGSGPAAVSAALYVLRANLSVAMITMGVGSLEKASLIENFYGLAEPLSGVALHKQGENQAAALGADIINGEVVALEYDGERYTATLANGGSHTAGAVILATGAARKTAGILGLSELEGRGVSYCAVCDGFFYRGKDVCVLGSGEYARHEAEYLLSVAKSVTLLTNGETDKTETPNGVLINGKKIGSLVGNGKLEAIAFDDGSELKTDGLFIALGNAGSTSLALTLGALVEGGCVVVDENMQTTMSGLFAAGDCIGGLLQVSKAVCDGAKAGTAAIRYVRSHA